MEGYKQAPSPLLTCVFLGALLCRPSRRCFFFISPLPAQGFLELRMDPWLRNLLTRLVAIVPSLAVTLIGGSRGAGRLIIISSVSGS